MSVYGYDLELRCPDGHAFSRWGELFELIPISGIMTKGILGCPVCSQPVDLSATSCPYAEGSGTNEVPICKR